MNLTITAASTALFSTWVFVEELGLLLDAGDGVSAALTQKTGKIKNVFVSHADRDHVCGLLQLHQLNARDGKPAIHYPKDAGTFPALRDFVTRFDPQSGPATWSPLDDDQIIPLDNGYSITAHPSPHIVVEGQVKALGYTLEHTRKRLKQAFQGLPGKEIAEKKKELGEDAVMEQVVTKPLGYSGDTPALDPTIWQGVEVLLHEATFLNSQTTRGQHSNLEQVIHTATSLDLEALVLMHFSARYKPDEIAAAIKHHANEHRPPFPIHAILPSQVHHNILAQQPVWKP